MQENLTKNVLNRPFFCKKRHLIVVLMPSDTRRSAFFRLFRCLLTGCRKHANVVKVPWEQGVGAIPTTLRLYAKCFTPIRKTLYAYTQNGADFPDVVLDWCRIVARFFAILHRRLY